MLYRRVLRLWSLRLQLPDLAAHKLVVSGTNKAGLQDRQDKHDDLSAASNKGMLKGLTDCSSSALLHPSTFFGWIRGENPLVGIQGCVDHEI